MTVTGTEYSEVCRAIDARPEMPKGAPALARMRAAFHDVGIHFPADTTRVIAVAGTNGKGSVARMLDTLLRARGERVGLYTSPHLVTMRERIRLAGEPVSETEFVALYKRVLPTVGKLQLTHFETLTLMAAAAYFMEKAPVDRAVFEAGMGGRWDPTNAIPHGACAITALGLDHQKFLGDTIEAIASEKFGIVSENSIVVHAAFPNANVGELARERAGATKSRWRGAVPVGLRVDTGPKFFVSTPWGETELSLPGQRSAENAAVALTLIDALGFDPRPLLPALARVEWPGRMQKLEGKGARLSRAPIYFSGDHNPQGVASLVELLTHYPRRNLHILVGIANTKDGDAMLAALAGISDARLYLTSPSYKRRSLSTYGESIRARAAGAWDDAWIALREVGKLAAAEDMIVVTGSLYLVGELLDRAQDF